MKLRKWDNVVVISWGRQYKTVDGEQTRRTSPKGKELGMEGVKATILKVFTDSNKVLVEGVNVVKRHIKKQGSIPGQVIEMEKPIDASNVQLVCPFTGKPTRIGFVEVDGKKFRYSKVAVRDWVKTEPKDAIIK